MAASPPIVAHNFWLIPSYINMFTVATVKYLKVAVLLKKEVYLAHRFGGWKSKQHISNSGEDSLSLLQHGKSLCERGHMVRSQKMRKGRLALFQQPSVTRTQEPTHSAKPILTPFKGSTLMTHHLPPGSTSLCFHATSQHYCTGDRASNIWIFKEQTISNP